MLRFRKYPQLPRKQVIGPLLPEADWDHAVAAAQTALAAACDHGRSPTVEGALGAAYKRVAQASEAEVARLTDSVI